MKPARTLLQGMPYTPSHATNIRDTFKRSIEAQREAEAAKVAAEADHVEHKQRLERTFERRRIHGGDRQPEVDSRADGRRRDGRGRDEGGGMKLCIDCASFKPDPTGVVDWCARKTLADPVRGTSCYAACSIERGHNLPGYCGRDGRHFVAKVENVERIHA